MEKLTLWKKEINKDYLGSWDLCIGADNNEKPVYKEVVATIKKIEKQATNFQGLENATGTPFIEKWVGKQVCVYVEKGVKAFGTTTDALRIKPVPKRLCDVCGKVISEEIYQGSMQKYGKALCSKECLEKAGIK